jgi:hypothetical protein
MLAQGRPTGTVPARTAARSRAREAALRDAIAHDRAAARHEALGQSKEAQRHHELARAARELAETHLRAVTQESGSA